MPHIHRLRKSVGAGYARALRSERPAGRRGLRRFVVATAALAMAAAALYAIDRHPFRVQQVLLDVRRNGVPVPPNDYRFDEASLRRSLPFALGDTLTAIDPAAVRAALLAQPMMKNARVHLQLPDTVLLQAEERVPTAVIVREGRLWLIDAAGVSMGPGEGHPDLLTVSGEGSERINAPENAFLLHAAQEGVIRAAVRTGHRRWNVQTARGVTVMLPEQAPEEALQRYVQLEARYRLSERLIGTRTIKVIDMRIPGRVYVRPAPEGET